jgi:hypothetical protein
VQRRLCDGVMLTNLQQLLAPPRGGCRSWRADLTGNFTACGSLVECVMRTKSCKGYPVFAKTQKRMCILKTKEEVHARASPRSLQPVMGQQGILVSVTPRSNGHLTHTM